MAVCNHLLSDSGEHQEKLCLADALLLGIHCKDSYNPEKKTITGNLLASVKTYEAKENSLFVWKFFQTPKDVHFNELS